MDVDFISGEVDQDLDAEWEFGGYGRYRGGIVCYYCAEFWVVGFLMMFEG